LKAAGKRPNMQVTIFAAELNKLENKWEYQVKDLDGHEVEAGKFFRETQLSNNK
jgi:hypothetical protein